MGFIFSCYSGVKKSQKKEKSIVCTTENCWWNFEWDIYKIVFRCFFYRK